MLFNKERRIKYLGFNDVWFSIIGIILLSFLVDYLIKNSFATLPFPDSVINYGISLLFTICNWLLVRPVIILLRIKFPDFKDNAKRIVLLFICIQSSVLLVDLIGNFVLKLIFPNEFHASSDRTILVQVSIVSFLTCLLYTSPSPRDLSTSRMPSSA